MARSSKALSVVDVLSILAVGGLAVGTVAVFQFGRETPVPVHWSFDGPDRWAGKQELVLTLGAITGIAAVVALFLGRLARRMESAALTIGRLLLAAVASVLGGLLVSESLGYTGDDAASDLRIHMAALGFLFAVIGALVGKAEPNAFVGVRTYWSLTSRLAWDKSNRLCGRLFLLAGAAAIGAAPFAPQPLGFQVLIGSVVVIAAVSIFESWRVWAGDPHRHSV
jgi:uncharacterized membrane protein